MTRPIPAFVLRGVSAAAAAAAAAAGATAGGGVVGAAGGFVGLVGCVMMEGSLRAAYHLDRTPRRRCSPHAGFVGGQAGTLSTTIIGPGRTAPSVRSADPDPLSQPEFCHAA